MLRYFYGLVAVAGILFLYVWQQTQSVRLGYQVDNVRVECERLEQENKEWRLKVNRLISMERLDKVAQDNKLAAAEEKDIVYIK